MKPYINQEFIGSIGFSQLLAGILLITQRFSNIGSIVFYPIILNIFFITLSYDFNGTPIITGLMLLANTFLLLWDYDKLKFLLFKEINAYDIKASYSNSIEKQTLWIYTGISLFITCIAFRLLSFNIKYWFWTCLLEGFVAFLIFILTEKKRSMLKN